MIIGVGIDVLNIKRFKKIVRNNPKILKRILTDQELEVFKYHRDPLVHYAGRFSIKESIIKAGKKYLKIKSFKDIEILKDNDGKPKIIKPKGKIYLSISHEENYIISIAIIEKP